MAMAKAEMEVHSKEHWAIVFKARAARDAGMHQEAVELAATSWPHIDGMLQFERKNAGSQTMHIDAIEIVLALAPFLMDYSKLDALEELVATQRRVAKASNRDLAIALSSARTAMWESRKLWNYLELQPQWREDHLLGILGSESAYWSPFFDIWIQMGVLRRVVESGEVQLSLATQMNESVFAKCPSCAAVGKAEKTTCLKTVPCPKCGKNVLFVILLRNHRSDK
jgi:hypothetical protein